MTYLLSSCVCNYGDPIPAESASCLTESGIAPCGIFTTQYFGTHSSQLQPP